MTNQLDEIAIRYGTDKSSLVHDYTKTYWRLFQRSRESVRDILELGVLNGASSRMWKEFFYNAFVRGVDLNPSCKSLSEERVEISIGRQEDADFLTREYVDKGIMFDVIVDDGSHLSNHQIASFEFLFKKCLRPGGLYIVEDVCCSYWESHGGGKGNPGTCVEYFKRKVDEINFDGLVVEGRVDRRRIHLARAHQLTEHQASIESIEFSNSLIIVRKL